MAHCKYEKLKDLQSELNKLRKLEYIKEPKEGNFYLKSKGFLHFHEKDDRRWADARDGKNWGCEIEIPFGASAKDKAKFWNEVKRRYANSI